MAVKISTKDCICCGMCEVACRFGAISLIGGKAVVDEDKCIECLECVCRCILRIIDPPDEKQ